MSYQVAIIGAGEIGNAVNFLLRGKEEVTVLMWDKEEGKVPDQQSLKNVVSEADVVFLCVPSWAIKKAAEGIASYLKSGSLVISLAKGIEKDSQHTMDQALEEIFKEKEKFALLSGPMLAEEIMQDRAAAAIFAAENKEMFETAEDLFVDTNLLLEYSDDLHGTALAGVLKNVYAVGMGIISGLERGNNYRGWYTMQSCREAGKIITSLGGQEESVYGLAGLGDLIATGFSEHSQNHEAGKNLAEGNRGIKSEGTEALTPLTALLADKAPELPVFSALQKVVMEEQESSSVFSNLLRG